MKIYDDNLDLYGPDGKILEESVPLESISPLKNSAIQEMIYDIKRSCAVNLAGIENGLKNAAMGGKATYIPGRELDLDIVEMKHTTLSTWVIRPKGLKIGQKRGV